MHGHLNCENYDETPDFGLPYKLSGLLSPFFFYPWSRPGQIERRIKNGTCCFCAGPMCKKRHNATYRRPNGLWRDANVCSLGLLSIILMMDQCDKHHLQSVENAVSKRLTWKYILMIYIYISNDIISYHIISYQHTTVVSKKQLQLTPFSAPDLHRKRTKVSTKAKWGAKVCLITKPERL